MATAGWSWVDGTNASNLNCGAIGCGPWQLAEPNNAVGGTENKAHMYNLDLNDNTPAGSQAYTPSHVCEIEVCAPGQYLGPTFTTGCLQCPPGSYSAGGAVGGCTLCPPGTFGNTTGLTTPACSGNCSASPGYGCPAGSTNSSAVMCAAGRYSSIGAGSCSQCPSSTPFSSPGSGSCYAACPDATWTPWLDTAGVEGAHSCLKRFSSSMLSFDAALANCSAIGSTGRIHLLTSRQVCERKSLCLL